MSTPKGMPSLRPGHRPFRGATLVRCDPGERNPINVLASRLADLANSNPQAFSIVTAILEGVLAARSSPSSHRRVH